MYELNDAFWPERDRIKSKRLSDQAYKFSQYKRRNGFAEPNRCDGCKKTFNYRVRPGYMLIDRVWKKLTTNWEDLFCHRCIQRRLGRPVPLRFMVNCDWNLDILWFRGRRVKDAGRYENHL